MKELYQGHRETPLIAMGVFRELELGEEYGREQLIIDFQIPKVLSNIASSY